jgi:hypothetical protein
MVLGGLLGLALLCHTASAAVTINKVGSIHLPFSYTDVSTLAGPTYKWNAGVGEQFKYDMHHMMAYVVGENKLVQIVNMSDSQNPVIVAAVELPQPATDVEICGDWVAIAIEGSKKTAPGHVLMYKKYQFGFPFVPEYTLQTGALPDHIIFSSNCSMLLTANEGEGAIINGVFENPPGSVTVFTWPKSDLSMMPMNETITFDAIAGSSMQEEMLQSMGVNWAFGPHTPNVDPVIFPLSERTLVKDLEPEYIALSRDGMTAYVCLQEADSIAVIDLMAKEVKSIMPLAKKDWMAHNWTLDASDKDGSINMKAWPVKSLNMPDTILTFTIGDIEYIATANEGDAKEYLGKNIEGENIEFAGDVRGKDIYDKLDPSIDSPELRAMLQDSKMLGRLKLDGAGSLTMQNQKYTELYALASRSFSIYKVDPFELVYDSGEDIEMWHKMLVPEIFNSAAPSPGGDKKTDTFDSRSDDKGPEVETLAFSLMNGTPLLFVACERTSTVLIYDVSNPYMPVFQSLTPLGGSDAVPSGLGDGQSNPAPEIGVHDPESMYVDGHAGKFIASGSVSGVLAIYDIVGESERPNATHCDKGMPWGLPDFRHCALDTTLQELAMHSKHTNDPTYFVTGGLGSKKIPDTPSGRWVCIKNHWCATGAFPNPDDMGKDMMGGGMDSAPMGRDEYFCFVHADGMGFIPWGDNKCLNLVRDQCLAPRPGMNEPSMA